MWGRSLSTVMVLGAMAVIPAAATAANPPATGTSQSVTATGTGQVRVKPANRHNNASIAAAVDKAHIAAIGGALSQAHEYASDYAASAGLTLGSVQSITDAVQSPYYAGPGAFFGPFGTNQYCGTIERFIGRPVKGKKLKLRKVHRCFVPAFAYTTLTVTYSAS